jgi:hypothetical protein
VDSSAFAPATVNLLPAVLTYSSHFHSSLIHSSAAPAISE